MSKTHRRQSPSSAFAGETARCPWPLVAEATTTDGGMPPWLAAPHRRERTERRMPRDDELRIELQTLFDDEPDGSPDGGDDVWRSMGLDPAALCIGDDGLLRLTVV